MNLPIPVLAAVALASVAAVAAALLPVRHPAIERVDSGTSIAIKQDKGLVESHMVRTIPMSPLPQPTVVAPQVLPDPVLQTPPPPKVAQYIMPVAPPAHSDICKRHGGHKVTQGRSWHCAYPRPNS